MKIYADAGGKVVCVQPLDEENLLLGTAPTATVLECDTDTNLALAADFRVSLAPYTLAGGVLKKSGVTVTINAASVAYTDRKQALTLANGLIAYNNLNNPTTAQTVAVIKANNRLTLIIGRLLLKEITS